MKKLFIEWFTDLSFDEKCEIVEMEGFQFINEDDHVISMWENEEQKLASIARIITEEMKDKKGMKDKKQFLMDILNQVESNINLKEADSPPTLEETIEALSSHHAKNHTETIRCLNIEFGMELTHDLAEYQDHKLCPYEGAELEEWILDQLSYFVDSDAHEIIEAALKMSKRLS